MMMIPAGKAVDEMIETLIPFLAKGDIIIDGGNSNFQDTTRRTKTLKARGCCMQALESPVVKKARCWDLQ